jgi:LmbE family N-acetylglucosaminyl deacetylase
MPTDREVAGPVAVFLFAHQDDEFGVYDCIARSARVGTVVCAYFTDGAAGGDPQRRDAESRDVLRRLGVAPQNVHCFGSAVGIPDGRLYEHLDTVAVHLAGVIDAQPTSALVHVLAWEGGHPDHDGLHAVAASLMQARGRLAQLRQFSLYHGFRCIGPFFRVLSPLAQNGPAERWRIGIVDRFRQLRHCLRYSSQRKTWIGLFPFVALRILLRGRQSLQHVDITRLDQRPHEGPLYYERRGFLAYERMREAVAAWRSRLPIRGGRT